MTTPTLAMSPPTIARLPVDLILESAAHDHVELEHQLVVFREMLQASLALLHRRERELKAADERYQRLLDEHRRLRGHLMRSAA
jgi:hypothetical protein